MPHVIPVIISNDVLSDDVQEAYAFAYFSVKEQKKIFSRKYQVVGVETIYWPIRMLKFKEGTLLFDESCYCASTIHVNSESITITGLLPATLSKRILELVQYAREQETLNGVVLPSSLSREEIQETYAWIEETRNYAYQRIRYLETDISTLEFQRHEEVAPFIEQLNEISTRTIRMLQNVPQPIQSGVITYQPNDPVGSVLHAEHQARLDEIHRIRSQFESERNRIQSQINKINTRYQSQIHRLQQSIQQNQNLLAKLSSFFIQAQTHIPQFYITFVVAYLTNCNKKNVSVLGPSLVRQLPIIHWIKNRSYLEPMESTLAKALREREFAPNTEEVWKKGCSVASMENSSPPVVFVKKFYEKVSEIKEAKNKI